MPRGFIYVIMFALCGSVFGCAGSNEYTVIGTARAAGADGKIQVETVEGGNQLVTLEVTNLPPPSRLGADLTMYVVWFISGGQPPVVAGTLGYDADSRKGKMMATTPLKNFRVVVTAERSRDATAPSEVVVVEHTVSAP